MAKWKKVEHVGALKIAGVKIEAETEDKKLKAVLLTDAEGRTFKIASAGSYEDAIKLFEPQPFDEQERHVVRGEIAGVRVEEFFDSAFEAKQRQRDLEAKDAKVEVVEVKVLIDDAGNVVKQAA